MNLICRATALLGLIVGLGVAGCSSDPGSTDESASEAIVSTCREQAPDGGLPQGAASGWRAFPDSPEMLLSKKAQCLACHAVEKQVVGPSFRSVRDRYRCDPTAEAKLVKKIKNGGTGRWGQLPMPPNADVSDEDIKTLVAWILE